MDSMKLNSFGFVATAVNIILFLSMILVIIKHKQNITRLLKKKERIFQVGKDDLNQENINKHQKEIRNEK